MYFRLKRKRNKKLLLKFTDRKIFFNGMMGDGHHSHTQTLIFYLLGVILIANTTQRCQTTLKVILTLSNTVVILFCGKHSN